MKIGFTGTQRGMSDKQWEALYNFLSTQKFQREFHHGDCVGADKEAHGIARMCCLHTVTHPPIKDIKRAWCFADETRECKDYLDRNHDIVDETDMLVATPGEQTERLRSGTWATIRYARKQHKPMLIIFPDGSVEDVS